MATTPNYGWVTPAPTDFVTDLPADFETFADAVDGDLAGLLGGTTGQVLAKDTDADHDFSWVTPAASPITTEGDLIIGNSSGAAVRLPIGAANTVLTSDGTTASYQPAGGFENYTLLNTGGTALTGSGTITISGISNKNKLLVCLFEASSASASSFIRLRINNDSGNNYALFGGSVNAVATYSANVTQVVGSAATDRFDMVRMSNNASSEVVVSAAINGGRSTGAKQVQITGGASAGGGTENASRFAQGIYLGSAAITEISVISSVGNFDNGTLYVYGSDL